MVHTNYGGASNDGAWYVGRFTYIVVATLMATSAFAQSQQPTFQKQPELQTLIQEYSAAKDDLSRGQTLNRIRALDAPPHHEAIRQSIAFASEATDAQSAMGVAALIGELKQSDRSLIEAAMPLLDVADKKLASSASNILAGLERRSAGRRPDLTVYHEFLADWVREQQSRPDGLIKHLYDADPGHAMLLIMRAHQLRDPAKLKKLLWAKHVVSNTLWKQRFGFLAKDEVEPQAVQELENLSKHDAWWARLYVATIMNQNLALRSDAVLSQLQQDADPLVRSEAVLVD